MAQYQRRFVMIRPGLDASRSGGGGAGGEALASYLVALSKSLVGLGHEVEIWTVQCDDEPAAGKTGYGVTIRRFPGRRDYSVPRLRPCAWVSEWVACATAHLTSSPGGGDSAAVVATLVTFGAEAGVAGRLLAQRFAFHLVHIPDVADASASDELDTPGTSSRRNEDSETCRYASSIIAITPHDCADLLRRDGEALSGRVALVPAGLDVGVRFLAAIARTGSERSSPIALASLGIDPAVDNAANALQRSRPWNVRPAPLKCSLA